MKGCGFRVFVFVFFLGGGVGWGSGEELCQLPVMSRNVTGRELPELVVMEEFTFT